VHDIDLGTESLDASKRPGLRTHRRYLHQKDDLARISAVLRSLTILTNISARSEADETASKLTAFRIIVSEASIDRPTALCLT
jgi:hypothetical protein